MGGESSFLGKNVGVKEVFDRSHEGVGRRDKKKRRWQRTEAVADRGGKVVGRRKGKRVCVHAPLREWRRRRRRPIYHVLSGRETAAGQR